MASPLSDAVLTQFKRVRGDEVLLRSERSLSNDLAAAEKAIRADIAALSVQVDALKPPAPEASPLAAAKPAIRSLFANPRPQIAPEAVRFIADRLTSKMTLLEWGGGASTPYFCDRVGVLHTVEASPEWGLVLLDYMNHRPDLVDRWRFHYVGANWTSVRAARRRSGGPLPEPDVRHRMEDDYALMIADRIDAIVVDGSVRQRTVARLADYVMRDRPHLLVVNATDTDYIAEAVAEPTPPPARQPAREKVVSRIRRSLDAQTISLLAALAGLVVIFGTLEPDIFFRPSNLVNIANAIALLAVVAVAQTLVILSGQLDISVGAITGLAVSSCTSYSPSP